MRRFLWIVPLAALACGRTSFYPWAGGDGAEEFVDTESEVGATTGEPQVTSGLPDSDADSGSTTDGTDGTDSTGEPSCAGSPGECSVQLHLRRAVDILFVIDNSGSMGAEQGTLAQSFGAFIDVLEAQEVGANYRIGVTTSAGDGVLRATSCRSRLHEFIFESQLGTINEQQTGCLNNCAIDVIELADPWVEKGDGGTNVPAGLTMAQVLQCIGPQGINGPGFERPLESMHAALLDSTSDFLRDDALLAVVFVTDEADCSMDPATENWLVTQGQVFWTDPERPTSAVCWTAGVACSGGPGVYDDCVAQDKGMDGFATDDPDAAILFTMQRYLDTMSVVAEQKQLSGGQSEVLVALLAGVPLDYPQTGVVVYEDSPLAGFDVEFGIGPGCGQGTETLGSPPGIPPVRLKEFAEAFQTDGPNIFSICSDNYGVALADIAAKLGELDERACVGGCVADLDPGASGLEPDCILGEQLPDGSPGLAVPPCLVGQDFWDFPSPQQHVCYRPLTDPDGQASVSPFDDMSAQCVTLGSNLEYVIERRDGVPVEAGTSVEVSCTLLAPVGTACDEI
ncbi:MAG: hypothetical protein JKY37_04070 [Nannocystaceae bacterium]|nr:hypothetical protein [Nannocystaceae bacterium]